MRNAIRKRTSIDQVNQDPHKELNDYLSGSIEDVDDPVKWWGVSIGFIFFLCYTYKTLF